MVRFWPESFVFLKKVAMIVLYGVAFAFFVSELALLIMKRSGGGKAVRKGDRFSLLLLWAAIPVSLTTAFILGLHGDWSIYHWARALAGISVFMAGMVLRWKAILQLKQFFTVDVAVTTSHQLITSGLYRRVRHPSYSGLLLMMTGLGLAMNSAISFPAAVLPFLFALLYRIRVEERLMEQEFGESYREYAGKTARLFPGIF